MASFDKPLHEQFFDYLKNPMGLGRYSFSLSASRCGTVIGERNLANLVLVGSATVVSVDRRCHRRCQGRLAAWQPVRQASTGVTLTLWGTPEFWLGMIFIICVRQLASDRCPSSSPAADSAAPDVDPLDRLMGPGHRVAHRPARYGAGAGVHRRVLTDRAVIDHRREPAGLSDDGSSVRA